MQNIKKSKLGRPISLAALAALAKKYNVSASTIWCVAKNKIWKLKE